MLQSVRRNRVLRLVVPITAALFALGSAGASAAPAASGPLPDRAVTKVATPAGGITTQAKSDCGYEYLCLWEGYNYTGTIHRLYNCEVYYTPWPIHSAYNHQTPGTRASFRNINNVQFWVSPAPNWSSGNTDTAANGGTLNAAFYVKPC